MLGELVWFIFHSISGLLGMKNIEPIAIAVESIITKKEKLQKVIEDLGPHRNGIQNCT